MKRVRLCNYQECDVIVQKDTSQLKRNLELFIRTRKSDITPRQQNCRSLRELLTEFRKQDSGTRQFCRDFMLEASLSIVDA